MNAPRPSTRPSHAALLVADGVSCCRHSVCPTRSVTADRRSGLVDAGDKAAMMLSQVEALASEVKDLTLIVL
jgi:hypothetical protein